MRPLPAFLIATAALLFAGCAGSTVTNAVHIANRDAEASGSPFRWEAKNVKGGAILTSVMIDLPSGPSKADDILRRDILLYIAAVESAKKRPAPEVDEVRHMSDGREVWVLKHPTDGIAYVITMTPSSKGGTDFAINGPHVFEKKADLQ